MKELLFCICACCAYWFWKLYVDYPELVKRMLVLDARPHELVNFLAIWIFLAGHVCLIPATLWLLGKI